MTRLHFGLIAALVVIAGLAIAGWVRKPAQTAPPVSPYASNTEPADTAAPPPPAAPPAYEGYGSLAGSVASATPAYPPPPAGYQQAPAELPAYAVPRYVRTVRAPQAYEADREYVAPEPVEREHRDHHHHHRSTARSAEIVAGSAGVGAAVGAIAGGGKGAGIGALAGGAGGFVYDRLTHDR